METRGQGPLSTDRAGFKDKEPAILGFLTFPAFPYFSPSFLYYIFQISMLIAFPFRSSAPFILIGTAERSAATGSLSEDQVPGDDVLRAFILAPRAGGRAEAESCVRVRARPCLLFPFFVFLSSLFPSGFPVLPEIGNRFTLNWTMRGLDSDRSPAPALLSLLALFFPRFVSVIGEKHYRTSSKIHV